MSANIPDFVVACSLPPETQAASRVFSVFLPHASGDEPAEGPLVGAILRSSRPSIAGQIANKLTWESLLRAAAQVSVDTEHTSDPSAFVREAFRSANAEVYAYSHRMGAGGTMGTLALFFAISAGKLCAGRAGDLSGYLIRRGTLAPLFGEEAPAASGGVLARFVGANTQVLVDLASAVLERDDLVLLSSKLLDPSQQQWLVQRSTAPEEELEPLLAELRQRLPESVLLLLRCLRPVIVRSADNSTGRT